jgi:hypothetical protein
VWGAVEAQSCVRSTVADQLQRRSYSKVGVPAKMASRRIGGQRAGWRFCVNLDSILATTAFKGTDRDKSRPVEMVVSTVPKSEGRGHPQHFRESTFCWGYDV